MELFSEDGHLTNEGLRAVVAEGLGELQRLEASEHLSFCDECMRRYLALLSGDALLQPAQPLAQAVQKRIKSKNTRIVLLRYGTVAAAACLAVFGWFAGTYALNGISAGSSALHGAATAAIAIAQPAANEEDTSLGAQINGFFEGIFTGFFSGNASAEDITTQPKPPTAQPPSIQPPKPWQPTAQSPRGHEQTRQQREDLFEGQDK